MDKPTFEQWMLEHGMNNIAALEPAHVAKWRAKYDAEVKAVATSAPTDGGPDKVAKR